MKATLMSREYSDEDLLDLERDILEAIDDRGIPKDEDGFRKGTFMVTITWEPSK